MSIKENDFLELNYTGRLSDNQQVFDTTITDVAQKAQLPVKGQLSSVIIQVGKNHLLPGLEKELIGKEVQDKVTVHLEASDAFGKRDSKLVKLVPTQKFKEQKINPMPHLQVNIDGRIGTIRSVTGGRTLVDMNHPLAGKAVDYELHILRQITDTKEKLESWLRLIGLPTENIEIAEQKATVTLTQEMPVQLQEPIKKEILQAIPTLKEIVFSKSS